MFWFFSFDTYARTYDASRIHAIQTHRYKQTFFQLVLFFKDIAIVSLQLLLVGEDNITTTTDSFLGASCLFLCQRLCQDAFVACSQCVSGTLYCG